MSVMPRLANCARKACEIWLSHSLIMSSGPCAYRLGAEAYWSKLTTGLSMRYACSAERKACACASASSIIALMSASVKPCISATERSTLTRGVGTAQRSTPTHIRLLTFCLVRHHHQTGRNIPEPSKLEPVRFNVSKMSLFDGIGSGVFPTPTTCC